MLDKRYIEQLASDVITEKPLMFELAYFVSKTENKRVGIRKYKKIEMRELTKKQFTINPPTLGKMQVLSRLYLDLDIDGNKFEESPHIEAMRVCNEKTDTVCRIMAVSTLNTKEELQSEQTIRERAEFFKDNAKPTDFGRLLIVILTMIDYENFINSIRLTEILRLNKPIQKQGLSRVE